MQPYVNISVIIKWLEKHEFSYKKPALVPGKANREAQEQWIREYETLKARLPANETICFIDGVHPTHNTKTAYGWIRRGQRKEILSNTGRQRLNLSGAIDILTRRILVREDETLENIPAARKDVFTVWLKGLLQNAQVFLKFVIDWNL